MDTIGVMIAVGDEESGGIPLEVFLSRMSFFSDKTLRSLGIIYRELAVNPLYKAEMAKRRAAALLLKRRTNPTIPENFGEDGTCVFCRRTGYIVSSGSWFCTVNGPSGPIKDPDKTKLPNSDDFAYLPICSICLSGDDGADRKYQTICNRNREGSRSPDNAWTVNFEEIGFDPDHLDDAFWGQFKGVWLFCWGG